MAKSDPTFYIQYQKPKATDSLLTRYLVSKSNWVTIGAETNKDEKIAESKAIKRAKEYPPNIRVRVMKSNS